jgi:NAD(P)-dependent dehydrogenase (short-subunit alcohol dehydrogenase family)
MESTALTLEGRVAIVTGAGSGIGRSIATLFARAGAAVIVNDVRADRVDATVKMITEANGVALGAVADITDESAVNAIAQRAVDRFKRIDVLCNNAGIIDNMAMPADTPTAVWNRVIAVNLTAHFLLTRAVLPHMLAQKSGSIINTASEAGLRGGASGVSYTAAKHGLVGMTRNIAWTYKNDGIRCNAICPGVTETDISGGSDFSFFDQAGLAKLMPVIQLGMQLAQPEHMASVVLFLASDLSAFINGAIIPVDAGWSAG